MRGRSERETSVVRTTISLECPYLLRFENVVRTTIAFQSALDPQNDPECDSLLPILGQENPHFGTVPERLNITISSRLKVDRENI